MLRDRLKELIASEELSPGKLIVDFGCGNMPYRSLFQDKFGEYLGADLQGNAQADLIIDADGRISVENESVDCVLSTQVLEHAEDPASYLNEAARVLVPDGSLILSTHGIWKYHPAPSDYWRWTKDGLVMQIERAGFQVLHVAGVFGLLASSLQLLQDGLMPSLPKWSRRLAIMFIQPLIGLVERGKTRQVRNDASVYVVLARKANAAHEPD